VEVRVLFGAWELPAQRAVSAQAGQRAERSFVQGGGNARGNIVFLKPLATTIGQLLCTQIVRSG